MTTYAADEDGAAPAATAPFSFLAPCFAVIYGPYMAGLGGGRVGLYVAHDSHADAIASGRRGGEYRVVARGLTWADAHKMREVQP